MRVDCPTGVFKQLIGEALDGGRSARFRVQGLSMHPTIRPGDVVKVVRFDRDRAAPGDIIAFERGEWLVMHRIARLDRRSDGSIDRILTVGDGLESPDGYCSPDAVACTVVEVVHAGRSWRPSSPPRRALGRLRSYLAFHPGIRRLVRRLRRLPVGHAAGTNAPRGAD